MSATRQSVMGLGLPPEVPWVVFPVDLFLGDSDLTPLSEKLGEIEAGLTTWKPQYTEKGMITKDPAVVKGKDYAEAFTKYQYLALQNTWGDGLPVLPPTPEKIAWLLTGVEHKGSDLVGGGTGKVAPKAGILTYEVLATCMAMAGGRPEYMPVAEAVCKTLIDSQTTMLTSSGSAFPGTVINGPIKKQLRINSEWSLLGPNPAYPGGITIGRAIWLVLMNVGGHVAGQGSIGQYGEMRFTGVCSRKTRTTCRKAGRPSPKSTTSVRRAPTAPPSCSPSWAASGRSYTAAPATIHPSRSRWRRVSCGHGTS